MQYKKNWLAEYNKKKVIEHRKKKARVARFYAADKDQKVISSQTHHEK